MTFIDVGDIISIYKRIERNTAMKKFLSAFLVITLILALASCSAFSNKDGAAEDETAALPSFTEYGETVTFDIPNATPASAAKSISDGEGISLTVRANPKSSITPNPGYPFPTLEEFFDFAVLHSYEGAEIKEENGVKYAEITKNGAKAIYVFYETEINFWYVLFELNYEKTDFDTARPTVFEYAKSATFSAAQAE